MLPVKCLLIPLVTHPLTGIKNKDTLEVHLEVMIHFGACEEFPGTAAQFEDVYVAMCMKNRCDLTDLLVSTLFGWSETTQTRNYKLCLAVSNQIHAGTVGKCQTREDIDHERDPDYLADVYRRAYEIWDG